MLELIGKLRAMNYEVNLMTNIRGENYSVVAPFEVLFDQVIHCPKSAGERKTSWENEWIGHAKSADQFLLIDDQEPNVTEAERLGMKSIQFKNVDLLTQQLIERHILLAP